MKNQLNFKKYSANSNQSTASSRSIWFFAVSFVVTLAILLSISMIAYNHYLYSDTTKPNTSINYEEVLFNDATVLGYISNEFTVNRVEFDPYSIENGIYNIYFDSIVEPYMYQGYNFWVENKDLSTLNDDTTFSTFSMSEAVIIQSARNLVCKYIQDSHVLVDKENLIQQIQSVPFYKYTDSKHPELISVMNAPAVHMGIGIYCNEEFEVFFCEYMFVHELIHHLRYLTNDKNICNEKFFATAFDETIADIITHTINPLLFDNPNYISGYTPYYDPIYSYLSVFKEDALEAYFYGYDNFVEKYGGKTFETEHNLFVVALDSYETNPNTPSVCDGLFHTWRTRLSEI